MLLWALRLTAHRLLESVKDRDRSKNTSLQTAKMQLAITKVWNNCLLLNQIITATQAVLTPWGRDEAGGAWRR